MERVSVVEIGGEFAGWLRWNLFWDNTPFLNMLYLLEPFRGKGHGRQVIASWEEEMQRLGFDRVMTSTASDEYAQHFYQKLGYAALGGFSPFGDAYELIFGKIL
jgi:GNAT superfamily N-acetyltransferase